MTDEQIIEIERGIDTDGMTDVDYIIAIARSVIAAHEQARGQPEDLLALRKDAQRYRLIRMGLGEHGNVYAMVGDRKGDVPCDGDRLDEAADRARAALAGAGESK